MFAFFEDMHITGKNVEEFQYFVQEGTIFVNLDVAELDTNLGREVMSTRRVLGGRGYVDDSLTFYQAGAEHSGSSIREAEFDTTLVRPIVEIREDEDQDTMPAEPYNGRDER